jgi:uncharacterized LabA/DUF88 family protein
MGGMIEKHNNYAFIDSQNVHKGVRSLGWQLDWVRFRVYLQEKYGVDMAYLFIGFMPEYTERYIDLQRAGFVLKFKPVLLEQSGAIKGNVDADLVLRAMIDYGQYDKAVIVTSDGDFYSLVEYLNKTDKLQAVLSPRSATCSGLLKKIAGGKMAFMEVIEKKLSSENKTAPLQDGT